VTNEEKVGQLMTWAMEIPDARLAIKGIVMSYKCATLEELAESDQEAFDLLYHSIGDMVEQIPNYWTP
jgi:hypothetical protein